MEIMTLFEEYILEKEIILKQNIRNKYFTPCNLYDYISAKNTFMKNGLIFENICLQNSIKYIDQFEMKNVFSKKNLFLSSTLDILQDHYIDNELGKFKLKQACLTDLTNDEDEIEIKYYYGNENTLENGMFKDNIFIPIGKLEGNTLFIPFYTIHKNRIKLYNIWCTHIVNGQEIGFINSTYNKNYKFIIAHNNGIDYYNFTDDMTDDYNNETNKFHYIINEQLSLKVGKQIFVVDMLKSSYMIKKHNILGKNKLVANIPSTKLKPCYIKKHKE